MTERVEQWICIRFFFKLEHSSVETIPMIQKAPTMGNWWLAASTWRGAHSFIMTRAEVFGVTSNHPDDLAPLQPTFGTLQLLTFPKTKITFEREEIWDHCWEPGKYDGAAAGDWENCVRSQGAYFEGEWSVIVLCTMCLLSCIFFNTFLYFSYYTTGYLPRIPWICLNSSHTHAMVFLVWICSGFVSSNLPGHCHLIWQD